MHKHLPLEILRRFGKRESSALGDSFYVISPEHRDGMLKALREAGLLHRHESNRDNADQQ